MYEYGTARKPIVIRTIAPVDRGGVTHNVLQITERLFRIMQCCEYDCDVIYAVIIPALTVGDVNPLSLSYDGTEFAEIYPPTGHVNATTDKIQPHAGTRRLISFRLDSDEHYNRVWRLNAVHDPCVVY